VLFKAASKFETRYATFGFEETANLDDGAMGDFGLITKLTPADEAKIAALVGRRRAISKRPGRIARPCSGVDGGQSSELSSPWSEPWPLPWSLPLSEDGPLTRLGLRSRRHPPVWLGRWDSA
jgi:hypothetical protein